MLEADGQNLTLTLMDSSGTTFSGASVTMLKNNKVYGFYMLKLSDYEIDFTTDNMDVNRFSTSGYKEHGWKIYKNIGGFTDSEVLIAKDAADKLVGIMFLRIENLLKEEGLNISVADLGFVS